MPKGSILTRSEIIDRCTKANVHVVSVERQGAPALERQQDLEVELRELKSGEPAEIPGKVLDHERTTTSLQLLARLQQAIAKIGRGTKGSLAAGDARLVDTMRLVDRHLKLIEARGVELPEVTPDAVIERFDWHGDIFAVSSRLVRSELLDFYRRSFHQIARDARVAAMRTADQRAKSQYQALRELGESLGKVLASKVMLRK